VLAAAVFVPRLVEGVYWGLDREAPPALHLLATLWLFMSVAAWFWGYCRAHRVHWPMDMGWFLMLAWFVIVPYCIISRERWRGVVRIALFALALVASMAAEWATALTVHALVWAP
jgi:hypothetical protein